MRPLGVVLLLVAGIPFAPAPARAATGTVEGTVTGEGGIPQVGMCVVAYDESIQDVPDLWLAFIEGAVVESGSTETDGSGAYSMALPAGQHVLYVWDCVAGWLDFEWFNNRGNLAEADPLDVNEGVATVVPPIDLSESGAIAGVVTDQATGRPLEGIEVWTTDWSGYWQHWYAVTDASGSYYLGGLRAGAAHRVEFFDPNEEYHWEWFDDRPSFQSADAVHVPMASYIDGIDAALEVDRGTFIDDDTSIFENAIEWLADEGITQGCNPPTNDKFCPDDFVTRGEMAVFLVRALDYTDNGGGNLFIDDDGLFYENSADRLKAAKVTLGCNPPTNNKYCGESHVTRGQMAAFLVRAMGYTDNGGGNLFVDDDGHIFENAIDKLGTAGVTLGCNPPTNDRFCPDDKVTRGQMAAFLKRALG